MDILSSPEFVVGKYLLAAAEYLLAAAGCLLLLCENEGSFKIRSGIMAKPCREIKKANHGKRPANAKARRARRRLVKT